MIKYLNEKEKSLTKSLYKEAFFEDSDRFIDYYYSEKLKDNRILADIDDGVIRSMLMLNPYKISVLGKKYGLYYIVAVATKKIYRRQGCMRRLLNKALVDMNNLNLPFTYLIPANKDYYLPFDFAFVAGKNEYNISLSKLGFKKTVIKDKELSDNEIKRILNFINSEVSKSNDVYTYRDLEYFKREMKETASENGFINIYSDKENIVAYESFWGEKQELKERIVSEEFSARECKKENIMARITDIKKLLSDFRSNSPIDIIIKINDRIIEAQNNYFRIRMNDKSCDIKTVQESEAKYGFVEFDIGDFTSWIFGYKNTLTCTYNNLDDEDIIKKELQSINRISGIFINEYV